MIGYLAVLQLITFSFMGYNYIRAMQWINMIKMNFDGLVDAVLADSQTEPVVSQPLPPNTPQSSNNTSSASAVNHRERLAALTAGGQAIQYFGQAYTVDQIVALDEDGVEKLYARYEARLGAAMTKTLGQSALHLYTGMASMFLPIPPENQPKLQADLEGDPFIGLALNSATCELYHRYGMYLAPLTAALTTARHCRFEQIAVQSNRENEANVIIEPTNIGASTGDPAVSDS